MKKGGRSLSWIPDHLLDRCEDEVYKSFASDTQKAVFAISKKAGGKDQRRIYNRCYQINQNNYYLFNYNQQINKDKIKLAHVETMFHLLNNLLPLLQELEDTTAFSIATMAIVKNRQVYDMIESRIE